MSEQCTARVPSLPYKAKETHTLQAYHGYPWNRHQPQWSVAHPGRFGVREFGNMRCLSAMTTPQCRMVALFVCLLRAWMPRERGRVLCCARLP
jgi:hypothetical protein